MNSTENRAPGEQATAVKITSPTRPRTPEGIEFLRDHGPMETWDGYTWELAAKSGALC